MAKGSALKGGREQFHELANDLGLAFHQLGHLENPDETAAEQFGRYFGRCEQRNGRWKIADWRISVEHVHAYEGTARLE